MLGITNFYPIQKIGPKKRAKVLVEKMAPILCLLKFNQNQQKTKKPGLKKTREIEIF